MKPVLYSLARVDVANADGNKVATCTAMADVAKRGLLISLGGRSRIRVVSEGGDYGATEVPQPEVYSLVQAEIVRAGRVTLTRDDLDALCAKVRNLLRSFEISRRGAGRQFSGADPGWLPCQGLRGMYPCPTIGKGPLPTSVV